MVRVHPVWRRRSTRVAALIVLALAIGVAALVHAPFVRRAVLARLTERLNAAGLRLTARGLSYSVLGLRAELDGVTLSAVGQATPFLTADTVRVDVPWSVLWGTFALQSVEIDRPRVVIIRDASGTTNLPLAGGGGGAAGPVSIDRLLVRGLDLRYEDAANGVNAAVSGTTLDLTRQPGRDLAGLLSMTGRADVRADRYETSIGALQARLAFDGTTLTVASLDVDGPAIHAHAAGRVGLLSEAPRAAVEYQVSLNAAELAPAAVPKPAPNARVSIAGRVDGPLDALVIAADVTTSDLAWPGLGAVSLTSHLAIANRVATVDGLHATVAGGTVTGSAAVHLDERGASTVRLGWSGVDVAALGRVAPTVPVPIAGHAQGDATYEWTDRDVMGGRGQLAMVLHAPGAGSNAMALEGRISAAVDRRQWTMNVDQRVVGVGTVEAAIGGRLASDFAATSIDGNVQARVSDLQGALSRLAASGHPLAARQGARHRPRIGERASRAQRHRPRAAGQRRAGDLQRMARRYRSGDGNGGVRSHPGAP